MVEQVGAGRDKALVAPEIAVLAGQQRDRPFTDQGGVGTHGHHVVHVGVGQGVALGTRCSAVGFGDGVGLDVHIGHGVHEHLSGHVDGVALADGGVGRSRGPYLGVDQGDGDGTAQVQPAHRRAAQLVVGAQFQQAGGVAAEGQGHVVAQLGGGRAVDDGVRIGAGAGDHATTAAARAHGQQVGALYVVGGQHTQLGARELGTVIQPGHSRTGEAGRGHGARATEGRGVDGLGLAVVANLAVGAEGGRAGHREACGCGRGDRAHVLLVVHRGLSARTGDDAAAARLGVGIDELVTPGADGEIARYSTAQRRHLGAHRRVAGGACHRHTRADKTHTHAGGGCADAHGVVGRNTHIARGQQVHAAQVHRRPSGVAGGGARPLQAQQQTAATGHRVGCDRAVTTAQHGRDQQVGTTQAHRTSGRDVHVGLDFGQRHRNTDGGTRRHRHAKGAGLGRRIGSGGQVEVAAAGVNGRATAQHQRNGARVGRGGASARTRKHPSHPAPCAGLGAGVALGDRSEAFAGERAGQGGPHAARLRRRGGNHAHGQCARTGANGLAQQGGLVQRSHADQAAGLQMARQRRAVGRVVGRHRHRCTNAHEAPCASDRPALNGRFAADGCA